MYKNDIGMNAGAIWYLLSEKGELTMRQIGEYTHYSESFINLSLGWLARENKIVFYEKDEVLHIKLRELSNEMYY